MKKNLRIVSAAAAALLAVAPVAASVVSTVSADTQGQAGQGATILNPSTTTPTTPAVGVNRIKAGVYVASGDVKLGEKVGNLRVTPWTDAGTPVVGNGSVARVFKFQTGKTHVSDYIDPTSGAVKSGVEQVSEFKVNEPNQEYIVVVSGMSLTNLQKSTDYHIDGMDGNDTVKSGNDANGTLTNVSLISDRFTVATDYQQGTPQVRTKSRDHTAVSTGLVGLGNGKYNVRRVVDEITNSYEVVATTNTTANANPINADWAHLYDDVLAGLKAAGITVDANGDFAKPAGSFHVTALITATNNTHITFPVTVNPSPLTNGDATFPKMTYTFIDSKGVNHALVFRGENNTVDVGDDSFNYVPLNTGVAVSSIQTAFSTEVSDTNSTKLVPSVDISKVNTAVAGKYPVTVSATNADGKTTKVTFMLTVGAKGATYKTIQSDIDVPVYEISGNTVTDSKTVLKNGTQVATYGEITVNGKSYTRLNSTDSTKYIETKYVDGSVKPVATSTKKVMHNAYIYDANHKRVGTNKLGAYSNIEVYGTATKLADGSLVYKIGDNQYVMADNIDGTARTLSHNAYVYKTSKKRADRRVLHKGATVVTYGSPYTFKNGKAYYRIGGPAKQYVKVANFK